MQNTQYKKFYSGIAQDEFQNIHHDQQIFMQNLTSKIN